MCSQTWRNFLKINYYYYLNYHHYYLFLNKSGCEALQSAVCMLFLQCTQTHTLALATLPSHRIKVPSRDETSVARPDDKKKLTVTGVGKKKLSPTRWCVRWEQVKTFSTIWQSFTDVSRTRFGDAAATECRASSLKCVKSVLLQPKPLPWCLGFCFFYLLSLPQENLGSCLSAEEMVDLMWCCAAASQLNLRRGTNMQLHAAAGFYLSRF